MASKEFYTVEEQNELIRKYREFEDIEARDALIFSNERMVQKIAHYVSKKTIKKTVSYEDLYQEGMCGLLRALDKFKPEEDVKFTTYAYFWIRKYINEAAYKNLHICKLPTTLSKKRLVWSLAKITKEIEAKGEEVTLKTLAVHLGTSRRQLREVWLIKKNLSTKISFDADNSNSDDFSPDPNAIIQKSSLLNIEDFGTSPDKHLLINQCAKHIMIYAGTLSARRRDVFLHRVLALEEHTLEEIGSRWGVTKQRVEQIQRDVDAHFRRYVKRNILK